LHSENLFGDATIQNQIFALIDVVQTEKMLAFSTPKFLIKNEHSVELPLISAAQIALTTARLIKGKSNN
jgi:hypothetical protein